MSSKNQPPSREILLVENLTKIFPQADFFYTKQNNISAVNNISFALRKGEILGLLGPNGAGKTTTIHMLLGTLKPTSGCITYFDKNFSKHRSTILQSLGFASGSVQLPAVLSVYQNLDIHARLYGFSAIERSAKIESLLKTFDVWHLKNTQTGQLSSGQVSRVILAKAFLTSPKIVFLDEITAGLDPEMAKEAQYFCMQQRDQFGTSILLASHNMNEIARMCDRLLIMKDGIIVANNEPNKLIQEILKVRLSLKTVQAQKIQQLLMQHQLNYTINDSNVTVEIDERDIAPLLIKLTQEQILYEGISIQKPNLEDRFLHITGKVQTL